jgi:hypothetical protein
VSYGVIRRLVPGEVMHFDHRGDMQEDRESPYADAPRREIYTLREHGGAIPLTLEQDVPSDAADMFREATPRAFARIKELSEARAHLPGG